MNMNTFANNKLLFSDEKKYRILRHLLFWTFWGFYFVLPRILNANILHQTGHFPNVFEKLAELPVFLFPQACFVYPLIYFVLPRYVFTGKYIKAIISLVLLLLLGILISSAVLSIRWENIIGLKVVSGTGTFTITSLSYLLALQASLTAGALAASFKIYKYYYLKHLHSRQLMKKNVEAQLQLLQAQVHPHFLFNTLSHIYSQTKFESPKGSKMIMGLSDMLQYILFEGQKPQVPLKQELMMITEYIQLEKIRYGNKLDVHVLTPDNTGDLYIAPLLLLPFVENCFKHGASSMLQDPWINLTVEVKDTTLIMKLMNGKTKSKGKSENRTGIGINNVRQRLELLYKGKYDLQIREEEEVYVVDLEVELIRMKKDSEPETHVV
jgi:sensor histidine kinase YesM